MSLFKKRWAELGWLGRVSVFCASLSAVLLAATAVIDRNIAAVTGAMFAAAFAVLIVWVCYLQALNSQLLQELEKWPRLTLRFGSNITNTTIVDPPEYTE